MAGVWVNIIYATELELLSIVFACEKFRVFILDGFHS